MTPLRIKLTGFLSYREAQEVRFEGGGVWLLSGANGSGKSAVFDGVTFALFGTHRGGSSNAVELINKECGSASIEFDFAIGPQAYRIQKSIKRSKSGSASSTQQLFAKSHEGWNPVEDTLKKVDFDKWIHTQIGLTYETFTSSVLLLQNKAEKLLDAKPAARAEVLAGIVDLDRFKRLHEQANEKKNKFKNENENAISERDLIPEVKDDEFALAVSRVADTKAARLTASTNIEDLLRLEGQAKAWAESQTRLAAAIERVRVSEQTLRDAVKIENDHARLTELKSAIPAVSLIVGEKARIRESQEKTKKLTHDRDDFRKRKDDAEHKAKQAREKRIELKKRYDKDEADLNTTKNEIVKFTAMMAQLQQLEDAESDLIRLNDELIRIPADTSDKLQAVIAEIGRLSNLRLQLPSIERFGLETVALPQAESRVTQSAALMEQLKKEGEAAKQNLESATQAHADAIAKRTEADGDLSATRVLAEQAREFVATVESMGTATECRACGQPLTAKHLTAEKRKRKADLSKAESAHELAKTVRQVAIDREVKCQTAVTQATAALEELRSRYKDAANEAKNATIERDRLKQSLSLLRQELPAELRITEPTKLESLRREVETIEPAKAKQRELQIAHDQRQRIQAQHDARVQNIAKLKKALPDVDAVQIKASFNDRRSSSLSLSSSLKSLKVELESIDRTIDVQGREANDANIQMTDVGGKLNTENHTREYAQQAIDRALKGLAANWQPIARDAGLEQVAKLEQERDELIAAGTETKYRGLAVARSGLDSLRQDVERIDLEVKAYPPEVRREPEEFRRELAAAKIAASERENEVHAAERAKAELERHRLQRAERQRIVESTGEAFECYKRLATWLGRDYLQRYLVRTAERQILDHANNVLDRLSGGQLFLDLVTGGSDGDETAFDLICTNSQTGSKVPVAFLSGGQRFRVAVSLALGIGQYAGKQHRPIESVIIDEGFGSLDRSGRQTVIQELNNLRGMLRCVILVSHQEEFVDAFPNGYRFELKDKATVVSRLHG